MKTFMQMTGIIDFKEKAQAKPVAEVTTGDDGKFVIKDFIPGKYRIVYFWGDDTYKIEDYKSTIWTEQNQKEKSNNPNTWYKVNTGTRYSDALDNYNTRKKIDSYTNTETKMDSITPTVEFGVELKDDIANESIKTEGSNNLIFNIENVDFGIIERAKQDVKASKRVKSIKITLANGQVIESANMKEENGKIQVEKTKGVNYIDPSDTSNPKNGLITAELDNELIQGATLQIEYEIKVQNNSELDYGTKDYYWYGIKPTTNEEAYQVTVKGIYDYLDNTMAVNEDEQSDWELQNINEYNNNVKEATIIENYLHKDSSKSKDILGYDLFEEQYKTAMLNWGMDEIKKARQTRLANKTILHYKKGAIRPGEVANTTLKASKILSNTDEIELNNDVEITTVTQNTEIGRKVTPSDMYDRGETVTVITPTGENRNYIYIIGSIISFLIIIGTGIVFIKKKILK